MKEHKSQLYDLVSGWKQKLGLEKLATTWEVYFTCLQERCQ